MGKFDGWSMKDILRKKAERRRVLDERKKKRPLSASQYTRMCDALFMPQFRGKPCEKCYDETGRVNMNGTVGHHVILKSQSLFLRWDKRNICVLCQSCHFQPHNPSPSVVSDFMDWFKQYRPEDWAWVDANRRTPPAMKSRGYFEKMTNLRKQGGSDES